MKQLVIISFILLMLFTIGMAFHRIAEIEEKLDSINEQICHIEGVIE